MEVLLRSYFAIYYVDRFPVQASSSINELLPAKGIFCTTAHDKILGYLKQVFLAVPFSHLFSRRVL